jgi:NRPS condensation-like uncharacterized protein
MWQAIEQWHNPKKMMIYDGGINNYDERNMTYKTNPLSDSDHPKSSSISCAEIPKETLKQ